MIVVKGYGQLCNNLLQYAHAYAWGRENNVPVVSMRFGYKYQYFRICDTRYHSWPMYLFAKLLIKLKWIPCYFLDDPKDITPGVLHELKRRKLVAIDGFHFRHPALFKKYEAEIKELFAFKPVVSDTVDAYLAAHAPEADIRLGVHVRRGDYIRWEGGKHFFDDAVYIDYIRQFCQLFPDKKVAVFICTNDPKLRVETYRQALGSNDVFLSRGTIGEDLCLLSRCHYLIGVKSTFPLVASLYRNLPLYRISAAMKPLEIGDFTDFYSLFLDI